MHLLDTKSIYYDDVNLIAQPARIQSRAQVPDCLNRVFVAPMSAVVGEEFIRQVQDSSINVCIHRFCSVEENVRLLRIVRPENRHKFFVSIGLNDWDRADALFKEGTCNWLIDCANGYLFQIHDVIHELMKAINYKECKLMVGNVMTWEGMEEYKRHTAKYSNIKELLVRVNIAGGSACATNAVTGYNRGQITEINECYEGRTRLDNDLALYGKEISRLKIVADGGIKNSGYASKAFGVGADFVMMGGYFANATCAETWIKGDGTYWGGASTKQQELLGEVKRHSEGKEIKLDINNLQSLDKLLSDLQGGLSSAVSYGGAKSLGEFIGSGVFELKAR